jgi:peptide/nickel transport system substrate-binding protein
MPSRLHANTLVAAVILCGLTACPSRESRTPPDTIVVVLDGVMTSADPRYTLSSYDGKLAKLAHAGLTAIDTPSLEPRLDLAARVDRVDDKTWEVEVRPDAKFSDGSPVLAEDIAFTFESMMAEGSDSPLHRGFSERFRDVEVISPRVVRFHLHEKLATFLTDIDFGIVSRTKKGAGPYIVRDLDAQRAILERNPHYVPLPKMKHVEIKFVPDASARLLMLVGGSADLVQNGVRLDLLDEVAERPRVKMESAPSAILTYLIFNNEDPLLKDKRVRQAIALALDRPELVAAMFDGRCVLATGLLPPTSWAYEPDVARWNRDLLRAKTLLDEAGHRDPDGEGPLPRFRLVYKTSSDAFRVAIAKVIAAQLAQIGISVEVRSFERLTFFADLKKGLYQLASAQTSDIADPDYYFTYFHSSRVPDTKNPDGLNRWKYRNARVDELTNAGRHELDREVRKQLYSEVQKILADELPVVPLWHEDNVTFTNRVVEGYTMTANARLQGLITTWKPQ